MKNSDNTYEMVSLNLSNGEALKYALKNRKEITESFLSMQKSIIGSFDGNVVPANEEDYHRHYGCFNNCNSSDTEKALMLYIRKLTDKSD